MEDDERARAGAVLGGYGLDLGRMEDERPRHEVAQRLVGRIDEERLREERVVRVVSDDPDGDPVRRVRAREGVDDVDVVLLEVGDDLLPEAFEVLLGDRVVDVPPPDPAGRLRLAHDELVLRRAPGVAARVDDHRPALGEHGLVPGESVRVQHRGRRVPVHAAGDLDPVLREIHAAR